MARQRDEQTLHRTTAFQTGPINEVDNHCF